MSKDAPSAGDSEASGDGRMSRLRFRKKDMPGGLWLKCESCSSTIYRKEVVEKSYTCPACGFHFTMPGADRVQHTLDEGTWEELFSGIEAMDRLGFVDSGSYGDKIDRTVKRTGQNEALIAGRGEVLGRPVVLGVLDFKFLGGSMGEVVGEKIALCCDVARQEGKPLILFTASGGARMHEGMLSLMQMAKTCSALSKLNEDGGYSICVLTHPTTGGVTASFAMVCDLTLAEPGALIGFAGPRVIASTIKQELPEGFQRSEFLLEKGQVDVIVSRDEMRNMLARLIDFGADRPGGAAASGPAAPEGAAADESAAEESAADESAVGDSAAGDAAADDSAAGDAAANDASAGDAAQEGAGGA